MLWRRSGSQRAEELRDPLDLLWELVPTPLLHLAADGRILRVNEATGRLFDLRPTSLVGLSLRDLLSGPSPRILQPLLSRRTYAGRLQVRRADGERVEVEARAVRLPDGSVYLTLRERPDTEVHPVIAWIRSAIADLPVAVEIYDLEGTAVAANPAWRRLFGFPRGGDPTHRLQEAPVFRPPDRPSLDAALRGHVVQLPAREWTPPKGGPPRIVELVLAPIRDPKGRPQYLAAFALDVTGRWRVEESLRESEARYRVLIEGSPDAMFLLEDGVFRFVNRSFAHLFGVSSVEVVHQVGLLSLCVEEDRPRLARYLADRLAQQGEETVVFRGRRSDGGVITCELRANRVLLEGKPILMGVLRDVTHERHMAQTLRFQAELLECVHDAIIATDWEGRILYCNRASEALSGLRVEEMRGKRLQDLLQPEGRSFEFDRIRTILRRTGRWRGELQHRRDDGQLIWLSVTLSVNRNEAGEAVGIVGVYRDVTEQKRLEEQLIQAQKMESLGTLAGGIAHDFNNILGSIIGYLGLIKEDLPPDATLRQYFEVVERSALRASELTRQLLGFARRGKFTVQRVQLRTLCEEVLSLFRSTLHERITVRTHFPEDLPEVEGDPGQLQQVVLNLCMNAKDAMPQGGILELSLSEALADDPTSEGPPHLRRYVVLTVRDTGVGMDEYVKSRIFEPFFTTKEPGKGTGLGMAMVYGIVRNHGGFIDIQSEVGKGTTVQVYLPVPTESPSQPQEEAAGVAEGAGELILVVDDEEPLCNLLRDVLTRRGYRVLVARSGEEAVELYQQWRDEVDLVILDMIMPGMSGQETLEAILSLNPKARVLLTSGYTQEGAAGEALRKGAKGFLQKPYLITDLTAKVREVLEQKDG